MREFGSTGANKKCRSRVQVFLTNKEVQKWALTWPHCTLTKEECLERLQALPGPAIKHYVICREKHEDGSPHLHAYLNYETKVAFGPRRWDLGPEIHGDYEPCNSWRHWAKYCQKDGDFIANFDLEAATAKKASGRDLNKRLLTEDLCDLVDEGVIPLEKYIKVKANKTQYIRDRVPARPRCTGMIPNTFGLLLPLYTEKCRHYWFWSSEPNKGKTTFLKVLDALFPCYWWTSAEAFQSSIHPGTQFVFIDEYQFARINYGQLNQMCDGTWQYPVKCSDPVMLKDPVVIICGNKDPAEIYHELDLIKARFRIFNL